MQLPEAMPLPSLSAQLVAVAAGLALGLLAGLATPARRGPELLVDAVLQLLRGMPSLALLPLAAVWLVPPAQCVAVLLQAAFLPVFLHAAVAVRRTGLAPHAGRLAAWQGTGAAIRLGTLCSLGLAALLLVSIALRSWVATA